MKPLQEFLSDLRQADIKLWTEQERLRYSAPQGSLPPELLAQMKTRKEEILSFLQRANPQPSGQIQPISRDIPIPLSFAQQRLWFQTQLDDNQATYNISRVFHLTGPLNAAALEQAFQALIQRHETLRTSFQLVDDSPAQVIAANMALPLPRVELQHMAAAAQQTEVDTITAAEAQQGFDLTQAPLIRIKLLCLAPDTHILLLTVHHIIADGWSMGLLLQELSSLYRAFCDAKPPSLAPLWVQYADFTHWQRQWLMGDVLHTQLTYWKQQLADAPPLLALPTDRPRPLVQTVHGSTATFRLPSPLTQQLTDLSQRSGTTLFITLLTAFTILLSRYSNQKDIVVGSPIANRHHADLESLVGFFVNTLALRIRLEDEPTFLELLARVRNVALDAYAHQDLPFEKLLDQLQPERSSSYSPLFQVMFVLQNVPNVDLELPDVAVKAVENRNQTAKFDLTLEMTQTEAGLAGTWEYSTDLFDAATLTRLSAHFQRLLEEIIGNPQELVTKLPLLPETERQQILVDWNNQHQTDPYPQQCIHQLFEAQAEDTPDAIAAEFVTHITPEAPPVSQTLTYQQLNHQANQLAHHLQTLGVGPEVLVGLCIERSLDMVIGLLGILKAGGAYLPLDPTYPQERLAFMLTDSQVSVLLTTQDLAHKLPKHQATPVFLDRLRESFRETPTANIDSAVTPSNLAYVIYTSGSTGTPKGVMVEHQGLTNLAQAQIRTFKVPPHSRVLQFASLSFDASISEIVMALCSGARLCLAKKEDLLPGPPLLSLLKQFAISHITLPPSALSVLPQEELPQLKTLVVAGETCAPALMEHWSKGRCLINAYGPTEATVCATAATYTRTNSNPLVIGRPLENTHTYILDPHQHPVPIGIPGELYIGGIGVARGYLHRPQLTQEKFIPNPFSGAPFKHLYKTGDLARYLPDGTIEFLGRLDQQIKLRGFRIEPGEIEAVLAAHPTVEKATVVVWQDRPDHKRLIAYVVPTSQPSASNQPIAGSQLSTFLKQKLPDYMVPATFIPIQTLPLTANGKINYRALPKPSEHNAGTAHTLISPRIELERQLIDIWSNVLGLEQIGIRDNFFDIGGNSLLAVQVVTQIEKVCGYRLPVIDFFRAQTVEHLSQKLLSPLLELKDNWNLPWNPLEPTTARSATIHRQKQAPLFILNGGFNAFLAGAYWISRELGKEQPCYSLHLRGIDGQAAPQDRVEDMATEAIEGIRTLQPHGPYFLLGLCFGGMVAYEIAQQLQHQGETVTFLGMVESSAPRKQKQLKRGFGSGEIHRAKLKMPRFDDKTESDPNLLRVMRGVHRAQTTYEAAPYAGKLVIFQASEGTKQVLKDSQRDVSIWRALVDRVEVHHVAGDHETLYQEENLVEVIDILRGYLGLSAMKTAKSA